MEESLKTGIPVIKLKTIYYTDKYNEEEEERCKNLNIPYERKTEDGFVYVNLNKMGSFNKDTKDRTCIYIDGISWTINMKFSEFLELIGLEDDKEFKDE